MPIFVKDYTWTETDTQIYILLPLKGTSPSKAVILSTNNYLKVTFPPFIFEIFFKELIDDSRSVAKINRGVIEFNFFKKEIKLWGSLSDNLDKATILEKRAVAEKEITEREEVKSKIKADLRYQQRQYAISEQIELESEDKNRIQTLKDKEKANVANYLKVWKEENDDTVDKKYHEQKPEEPKSLFKKSHKDQWRVESKKKETKSEETIVDKFKKEGEFLQAKNVSEEDEVNTDETKRKTEKNESAVIAHHDDIYKPNLPPIIFKKKKNEKPPTNIPPPRERLDIQVKFTPRVFRTPTRESQAEEEQKWLEKQAEARRILAKREENRKPEECDPEWLKEKGDSFFKIENYHAAINAYSEAIEQNNKLPYLYSNRAACYLKLGNLHKTIEDCSKALELLDPPVASNAKSRLKALVRRGTAFCQLKLFKEGLIDYEAASQLDPSNEQLKVDILKIQEQ